jgi:hypothetical protein
VEQFDTEQPGRRDDQAEQEERPEPHPTAAASFDKW